jgi:predicted nuclease of predicted toxin-antitoxin system
MAVVRELRLAGHDVLSIAENRPGASDEEVASLASSDHRVLLTEDRDFGRLFYARLNAAEGVVYMRYPAGTRREFARLVVDLIRDQRERLTGAFVVMQPGRTRISRLPDR